MKTVMTVEGGGERLVVALVTAAVAAAAAVVWTSFPVVTADPVVSDNVDVAVEAFTVKSSSL